MCYVPKTRELYPVQSNNLLHMAPMHLQKRMPISKKKAKKKIPKRNETILLLERRWNWPRAAHAYQALFAASALGCFEVCAPTAIAAHDFAVITGGGGRRVLAA
jgi:hypothetical protein